MQHIRKPNRPRINETKSRDYKVTTRTGRSQNITNFFTIPECSRQPVYKIFSVRIVNHHLHLILTSRSLPYKKEYGNMTTKRSPKVEQYRSHKKFYDIEWPKSSVKTYDQQRKERFNPQSTSDFLLVILS